MTSSLETFEHKYGTSQQRLNELLHWAEDPNTRGTMPTQMVEELSTALEELHVAAEVMHEQAEQLDEAHIVIETERAYFQELFDLAPDGYVVTDQHGTIRRANRAAADLFHTEPKFLDGKPLAVLVWHEDRPSFRNWLGKVSQHGGRAEWEGRMNNRAGAWFPVSLSAAISRSCGGRIEHWRWLFRDLTERKRMENELRDRAEKLDQMNRAKDDFLAMLGHELRNPLVPLRNLAPILTKDPSPARIDWALGVLRRQVTNLTRLVDDLLDASRLSRGKVQIRRAPLDLAEVVRATVEDQAPALEKAGVALALELPNEPVPMLGDATRLAQVLDNLLHNAAKFTPAGGRVRVQLTAGEDKRATVSVNDTGAGIVPELLPNVFDIFTQGKGSLGGLGLGLAMVKGLVALHGGEVTAASEGLNRGATFSFWLPLTTQPSLPAENGSPAPSRPCRILVIDDDGDVAESLRGGLELFGHKVEVAASGAAGIAAARRVRPDIVLCDLGMAETDGYTVARSLREQLDDTRLPLIAYSGYGLEEVQRRALVAGFDLSLTKPLDLGQLQQAMMGLLVQLGR
jgi:PAS domain S-box-containing protein